MDRIMRKDYCDDNKGLDNKSAAMIMVRETFIPYDLETGCPQINAS